MTPTQPHISSAFDSGAIEIVDAARADAVRLRIRRDSHADFTQWFHFRLQGVRGKACKLALENAGECTYAAGWKDYQAVASYDREHWFRVPTRYDGKTMTIEVTPEHDSIWFAYFEPYSDERHLSLVAAAQTRPGVRTQRLGQTVQGRDMTSITVGEPGPGKKNVWIIARQHPGETMAEWFVEGMVEALLDAANPTARQCLQDACFYVVPNMNPDGSVRGNLRTNAAGANLNREWMEPDAQRSPEVLAVRQAIEQTGVDLFFDIHGDEALPYVFVAGSEMLPGFTDAQRADQYRFVAAFLRASPDFQTRYGYEASKYNEDALKLASKYIGHTYGCLSLTLEMPFKDNADLPDPRVGWDGARSAALGAAMLQAILEYLG